MVHVQHRNLQLLCKFSNDKATFEVAQRVAMCNTSMVLLTQALALAFALLG